MKNLIYIPAIILTALIISSCTPQKRLSRLIALHPELTTPDTVKITDTIITKKTLIDSAFHRFRIKDTITIEKDKLRLEIVEIFDTIYIQAQCDPDTIILEKVIPIEKIQNSKPIHQGEQKSRIDEFLERWWVCLLFIIVFYRLNNYCRK
ncbi:MAG: hypothetical protein C0596_07425 [Marinilabiliales bacterium]|nr:MAG: hypothetical protein C0596_07425 [Marinilabiliales bacterium]